jgi:hypothetical protein
MMRDWRNLDDRRAATLDFRDFMEQHPQTKKDCCDSPTVAKQQFALHGKFFLENQVLDGQPSPKPTNVHEIEIPERVQFKVYDADDDKGRMDSALLVLPSSNGETSSEPAEIWIAPWPQWGDINGQIAHLEAKLAILRQEQAAGEK